MRQNVTKIKDLDTHPILRDSQYFPIAVAAEMLDCSAQDLLHLGGLGKVEILSPVMEQGTYGWPITIDGIVDVASDEPFLDLLLVFKTE